MIGTLLAFCALIALGTVVVLVVKLTFDYLRDYINQKLKAKNAKKVLVGSLQDVSVKYKPSGGLGPDMR